MPAWLLAVEEGATQPWWPDRLLPVAIVLVLLLCVPLAATLVRRAWLAGLRSVPVRYERARRRAETALSFVRSIAYFVLSLLLVFFGLHAVWPGFNPLAATGALSIVALILTGMFKDVVVDVVKGLDILVGGHYDLGDFVEVDGIAGHVIDFQLKYTRLRTPSGEEIVLNNARCIPSRRFRRGLVTNHVSVPLENASDEAKAREALDRVAAELDHQVEAVQDLPRYEATFPLPATGGVLVRYAVDVLPGARWVIDDIYLPLIKRKLAEAGIPLAGDVSYFFMNDVEKFRQLFNRRLSRNEIEQWAGQEEEPAGG